MCFFRGSWMKVETWSWKMLIPMLCLLLCPLLYYDRFGRSDGSESYDKGPSSEKGRGHVKEDNCL